MSFKITANTVINDSLQGTFDNLTIKGEIRQVTGFQGQLYGYSSGGDNAAGTQYNVIERFPFAALTTNSSDVGDLGTNLWLGSGQSSEFHGYNSAFNLIKRFPFATGSTSDVSVGNLTINKYGHSGQSSKDYGYISGGVDTPTSTVFQNVIERFPFAAESTNSTDVGDLSIVKFLGSGQSSVDYGYYSGGYNPPVGAYNVIERFPFSAATTNVTDVGDLTVATHRNYGHSSYTHGYSAGGNPSAGGTVNVVERFPFAATTTNSTDVGDLTVARGDASTQSSAAYGYTSGGYTAYSPAVVNSNVIDRFTFVAATGNAADVGDLTVARGYLMGQQY